MSRNHASTTPSPNSSTAPTPPRSNISSSRSPPPSRNPSLHLAHMPSPASQHRQSFSESLRGLPPSPRSQRQPSLSQLAVQDLIDNPPAKIDPKFAGRDWRNVSVAELVSPDDLKFVEINTGVEAATNVGKPYFNIRSINLLTAHLYSSLSTLEDMSFLSARIHHRVLL